MIQISKPFLPPRRIYESYLRGIWKRNWLANNGPLVKELEFTLKEYLDLEHLLYVSNGTIALQIAIKALGLKGKIITTPFSYVATTSSIVWEGCEPVFVDIQPDTLNIEPLKIESAITHDTTAILATHVYGNTCEIDNIRQIAQRHQLKVIYDAAHCFGTTYKGRSVFQYGDISTTSFHATKLFHTIEGGAIITKDAGLLKKMAFMRNFGHHGPGRFAEVGINGKNTEFHAAMGLSIFPYIEEIRQRRKTQWLYYAERLRALNYQEITIHPASQYNYAYYPIIFPTETLLKKSVTELENRKIYPRRYFYPDLTRLPYIPDIHMPNASDIAPRVLCLPLYHDLSQEEQDRVIGVLLKTQDD